MYEFLICGAVDPDDDRRREAVRVPDSTVAGTTPLEQKKALYWHNGMRNEHVAAVALAVVAGNRAKFNALCLRNRDTRLIWEVDRTRTVVLVEAPEHGRELLLHLPGWRMLDMVPRTTTRSAEDKAKDNSMPAVVTAVYAARHSINADILVRADDFDPRAKQDAERWTEEYRRIGTNVRVPAGAQGEQ